MTTITFKHCVQFVGISLQELEAFRQNTACRSATGFRADSYDIYFAPANAVLMHCSVSLNSCPSELLFLQAPDLY